MAETIKTLIYYFLTQKSSPTFFYTIATIFASLMALSFSILLNSLQALSNKYNSYKIVSRFFKSKENLILYVLGSLGILTSLYFIISESNYLFLALFEMVLLIVTLYFIYHIYWDFIEITNPLLLINVPLKEFMKNTKEIRKKRLNYLEEIKEICLNSSRIYAKEIIQKIKENIRNLKRSEDKDLLNSYIKQIGKDWAKKSTSVPLSAIEILMKSNETLVNFAKETKEIYLIENIINYSRSILFEIERFQVRDVECNEFMGIFSTSYLFAKELKEKFPSNKGILNNLKELMRQIYEISKKFGFNKNQINLIENRFKNYLNEINRL